ncbi:uncharacterized protein ACRADG_003640 [Cochliomyia hominivorax]
MMANEETYYRTIKILWLFNRYSSIIIILILHLSMVLANETKAELAQNVTSSLESNTTSQQPMAEALIRFRRQPPRTVVKHIVRPKRYKMKRIKRPKIKYTFAEPPHPHPAYFNRKPISVKKPTFETTIYEDFSHMNVESADFDLPPSSYEAQSMDLDLYKHYEPSIDTTYKEVQKLPEISGPAVNFKEYTPTYTFTEPEIRYKEITKPSVGYTYEPAKNRKPHTKYGVPTEYSYVTGYDKSNEHKYTYEAPASKPVYKEVGKPFYNAHGKNEYSYSKPAKETPRIPATTYGVPDTHIPATTYGVPDAHIPVSVSNDYNKYSVVEQKPPYASYTPTKIETYHFAEPPQPEPSVEITYSPSYEINIPSSHENSYSGGKYNAIPEPQHPPSGYEEHGPPSYQDHPKYEEPIEEEYHPPLNHHVYEEAPPPHYEHTGPSYQEGSDTNQPASYQPAPPRHESIGITDHIPPSQNLPISVNHKQPPYDFPKSSYEVPIYDPVPFDASNTEEREIYPPQTLDHSTEQRTTTKEVTPDNRPQSTVTKPQSPINRLRRTRKRKRTKGSSTTVSTTKHILDVPELEEAFEKENRKKFSNSQDPEPDESHRIENINNHNSNNINNHYSNGAWNPMKIRTSPIMNTTPSTTSSLNSSSMKNRRYHIKQRKSSSTTTTTTTTTEAPPQANVEIISIEKSRSKTYYDGPVSTPKIFNANFFRNRFRTINSSTTEQPQMKSTNENKVIKRTTKNVFDTTIFKSPVNERDVYRNLPKNHKLN